MLGTGSETEETMILADPGQQGGEGASPASLLHGTAFQSLGCDLRWG